MPDSCSKKDGCKCIIHIKPTDVNRDKCVIRKSGYYRLKCDTSLDANNVSPCRTTAILIKASNVVLDLYYHTLSGKKLFCDEDECCESGQNYTENSQTIHGIEIAPGVSNIIIMRGTIQWFSGNGINAGMASTAGSSIPAITNLKLIDVDILNNGNQSLAATPATVARGGLALINIKGVELLRVKSTGNVLSGIYGIDLHEWSIQDSHIDDNTWGNQAIVNGTEGNLQNAYGVCYIEQNSGSNFVFRGSSFNGNQSVVQTYGLNMIFYNFSTGLLIDGCQINGNVATLNNAALVPNVVPYGLETFGLNLNFTTQYSTVSMPGQLSGSFVIQNSQISSNGQTVSVPLNMAGTATSAGNSVTVAGINVGDTFPGTNLTIKNCEIVQQFMNIDAAVTANPLGNMCEVGGIRLNYMNAVFNNFPPAQMPTNLASACGILVDHCTIGGQLMNNTSSQAVRLYNHGIETFANYGRLRIKDCTFQGSTNSSVVTTPNSQLVLLGVDLALDTDVLIQDCHAASLIQAAASPGLVNVTNADGSISSTLLTSYAAGFKLSDEPLNFPEPIVFSGPMICQRCTATGIQDVGGLGGGAYGFTTRESSGNTLTANSQFQQCTAINCTTLPSNIGPDMTQVYGAGFDLVNASNTQVLGGVASANNIGVQLSEVVALGTTGLTQNCTVAEVQLSGNSNYGIQDTSAAASQVTNVFYENRAKTNGMTAAVLGNDSNYQIATGNPIRIWVKPGFPNTVDNNGIRDPLDNISIA